MFDISYLSKFKDSISTQYNITSQNNYQDVDKKDFYPLSSDPLKECLSLGNIEKAVFKEIINLDNNYELLYFSQKWLANKIKKSRKTINHTLKSLVKRGYITKKYNYFSTCDYTVSPFFKRISIRKQLISFSMAFSFISISVLKTSILHAEIEKDFKVTRIKNLSVYIKNYLPRLSKVGGLYTSKVVHFEATRFSHRKKRKFVMKNPIIPEIRHIPGVSFTVQNQIGLSLFPAEAIRFTLKEFLQCKDIRNPFGWFRTVCNKYCQEKGIQPNYQWVTALEAAYKNNPKQFSIQDTSPYTPEDLKPPTKISQTKNYGSQKFPKKGNDHFSPTYKIPHRSEEEIVGSFREKKKAWIQTLPPATEETMRSMAKFFPGTLEELEMIIAKNNEERIALLAKDKVLKEIDTPIAKPVENSYAHGQITEQPLFDDEPPLGYGLECNDDSLYEEIM